ncbi:hypothetical protein MC885_021819 [Smutsia gigantea]|nr:hypothetical protein MC885_021819 [Smutsia gigantea]
MPGNLLGRNVSGITSGFLVQMFLPAPSCSRAHAGRARGAAEQLTSSPPNSSFLFLSAPCLMNARFFLTIFGVLVSLMSTICWVAFGNRVRMRNA